jgi:DNA-binding XRE family transcriptional regulator
MASKRKATKSPLKKLKGRPKPKTNTLMKNRLTSFDDFLDSEVGKAGTRSRLKYEAGYKAFELGVLLQEARLKRGLTQEKVAELSGTDKSYISKIEKDLKDIRFKTLQKIIRDGLGGTLVISIKF